MQIPIFKKVYSRPLAILVLFGLVLNILTLKSPILGLILSVIWIVWLTMVIKKRMAGDSAGAKAVFLAVAYLIIINSAIFYSLQLTTLAIILILSLTTFLGIYFDKKSVWDKIAFPKDWRFSKKRLVLVAVYLFFYLLAFIVLFANQSAGAIRTPWEVVPKIFFIVYFFLTAILIFSILSKRKTEEGKIYSGQNIFLLSLHFLLSLIIATVVYKIGFGFDPFVHRAAEVALAKLGYISPKPLYYIGQYSLVVWWSKISMVSIEWIDKFLVPVSAALLLPIALYASLKEWIKDQKILLLSTGFSLIIITPLFFYTVPQSLANLLFLTLIFFSLNSITQKEKIPFGQWLMLTAIFFIHPLTALAAFVWLVFWMIWRSKINKILKFLGLIILAILIPLFFLLLGRLKSDFAVAIDIQNLIEFAKYLGNGLFNYLPFQSIYHLLYLYAFNGLLLFLALSAVGFFYLKKKDERIAAQYLLLILIFLINLFLVGLIDFQALIGYEQMEFTKRLLQIIALTVAPLFLLGLSVVLKSILKIHFGRWIVIFFGSLILTSALYLAYPHNDAFTKGRSYAVSKYDIATVQAIEKDANGSDYVVLANQSVAAASLQEFGFKKYYNNFFYYPIPTSSPLYEIYLDMIYNGPTLEKIQKAHELTGVKKIYFVVNDYWLDAKKRIEEAKQLTNQLENIEDKVWIFNFEIR